MAAPVSGGMSGGPPPVTVEASGIVGAFDWVVISLDDTLTNPADAAATWLNDNGYDVPSGAPALLRPYLEDGLYLLALKLTKGSDVGSIRPIMLTYDATRPMIPVKLTAVAANDDMGVMTWVLGETRSVPQNYLALELNEARINWFNASQNYNSVVTAAADDAGGQGFVTEYAEPTTALANLIWSTGEDAQWTAFRTAIYSSFSELFLASYYAYGPYEGYWDAVRTAVTLPDGVLFEDFKLCPSCYADNIQFSPSAFMDSLESGVIEPMRAVQKLIDAHPMITRLYTTMSADEMTLDPLFTFNPDLPPVSNFHTAERIIECNANVTQFEAPWRIELPQGGVVRGTGATVGTWPAEFADQPPNRTILRLGESGEGKVIEDNGDEIDAAIDAYNGTLPDPTGEAGAPGTGGSTAGTGGSSGGSGGTTSSGGSVSKGGSSGSSTGGSSTGGAGTDVVAGPSGDGCSCRTTSRGGSSGWLAAALALVAVARRRRRR